MRKGRGADAGPGRASPARALLKAAAHLKQEDGLDITRLIADDHTEQRRLFALIEDIPDSDSNALQAVWGRLHALLDTHAEAEERFFYPDLLAIGTGAGESPSASAETRDAIKDHDEIRDRASAVDRSPVGSREWREAVAAANRANSDHMAEEERQGLADFRRHAALQLRHELGVQFAAFEASHLQGVTPVDKDPDEYVREMSDDAGGGAMLAETEVH